MNGLVVLGLGLVGYFLLTRKKTVHLVTGVNEVVYSGKTRSVREATASIEHVLDTVSFYDETRTDLPVEDRWLFYAPDVPEAVSNLKVLEKGRVYFVKVISDVEWVQ